MKHKHIGLDNNHWEEERTKTLPDKILNSNILSHKQENYTEMLGGGGCWEFSDLEIDCLNRTYGQWTEGYWQIVIGMVLPSNSLTMKWDPSDMMMLLCAH